MSQTSSSTRTPGVDRDLHGRDTLYKAKETRRSFQTTEFFVMLAAIAGVIVIGYAQNDSLDAARIWTLVTALASAYMISRGLAKAGSRDTITDIRS